MAQGWISIHRKIQENELWLEDEPFDKRSAWIDLILEANHDDNKFIHGNTIEEVKRGSKVTSLRKLSLKWNWSTKKVKNFLELLQNLGMITYKSNTKKTYYTIVNYNVYQNENVAERNIKETSKKHEGNAKEIQRKTNNNELIMINNEDKYNVETIPYKEIINYLNEVTGSNYSHTTDKTKRLIKARINEGHDINDFKKVIDNKYNSWNGTEWQKYLRPSTLFGTKFEGYLNEKVNSGTIQAKSKKPQIKDSDISYEERQAFLHKKLAQKIPINLKGE